MGYGTESLITLPGLYPGTDVDADGQDFAGSNDSAGDVVWTCPVPFRCQLIESFCRISEVGAGTTSTPVLKVWNGAVDSGTLLATLTLGTNAAGTHCYEKPSSKVVLDPGSLINVEMDVKSVGGTITGKGHIGINVLPIPEVDGNLSSKTAV